MLPPVELFSPALFTPIGDLVQSIPDTTPGMHPTHIVAIVGPIIELKSDSGWFYIISSIHHSQNTLWTLPYPYHTGKIQCGLAKSSGSDAPTKLIVRPLSIAFCRILFCLLLLLFLLVFLHFFRFFLFPLFL